MKIKKIVLAMTLMISVTLLFGCSQKTEDSNKEQVDNKVSIVTTVFAPYDFAKQVAREYGDVTMLVPPASESHSYEPTPQDIMKIESCDVFIYGGGDSDEWVRGILSSIQNKDIQVIKMMDCVEVVEEEIVEGMEHEHEHEHEEEEEHEHEHEEEHEHEGEHEEEIEYDEHVWTSPENAIAIVKAIEAKLQELDLAHETVYKQNADQYIDQLNELDAAFKEVIAGAKRKEVIFADRFPLRYFVEAYDLDYYAAFPGCSTDTEPSAATVAFLIDKVKTDNIPVVFHIEMSNEKMADTICEATGAKKQLFNACHTVSKDDFEKNVTYVDIMNQNVEALREALQ